jgi:conjugal transfer pilus assembly protein TrbC
MEEKIVLRFLKWLMLLMIILLLILLCLFFQVADAQALVEKPSENFTEIFKQIEDSTLQNQKYAKGVVDRINTTKALVKPESSKIFSKESDVIEDILNGYGKFKQHSCDSDKKDGLRIYVSLSMPKNLLEQYDSIAKKIGAKLVMRGFKNNSFKETINYTQKIAIEVDPVAFKKFGIASVPSFVLSSGDKFDKLSGNVSINYALTKFKDKGDLIKKAQEYLVRFKSNENK